MSILIWRVFIAYIKTQINEFLANIFRFHFMRHCAPKQGDVGRKDFRRGRSLQEGMATVKSCLPTASYATRPNCLMWVMRLNEGVFLSLLRYVFMRKFIERYIVSQSKVSHSFPARVYKYSHIAKRYLHMDIQIAINIWIYKFSSSIFFFLSNVLRKLYSSQKVIQVGLLNKVETLCILTFNIVNCYCTQHVNYRESCH